MSGLTPPPRVNPDRSGAGPERTPRRRIPWLGAILFGVLGMLLYGVFFVLPRWAEGNRGQAPEEQRGQAPFRGEKVPVPVSVGELEEQEYFRDRAQQGLARAMELRDGLEARGVEGWGGADWTQGVVSMDEADRHLAATNYAGADGAYAEAIGRLEAVESRAPEVFSQALADGNEALAAGDSVAATRAFELALAIAPAAPMAADGLKRAAVLDDVVALLHEGAAAERAGDLDSARDRYLRAVGLDPLSQPARQSLGRVTGSISDGDFARAMSRGLAALENKEFGAAEQAFLQAREIRPNSSQVADALLRVQQARNLDRILVHGDRARGFEEQEQWSEALTEYDAVLAIDGAVRFAQEGSRRSRYRIDLSRRFDYHLANPDRLSTDAVYDEAEQLLGEASEIDAPGPLHDNQIAKLRQLLDRSATLVQIILESDERTEVTVYKVGRLGRFERHELELRPGTYTVVGSRPGYRDVRQQIVVEAGGRPASLRVSCTERI